MENNGKIMFITVQRRSSIKLRIPQGKQSEKCIYMRICVSGWWDLVGWLCTKGGHGLLSPWSCSTEELRRFLSSFTGTPPAVDQQCQTQCQAWLWKGQGPWGWTDTPQLAAASAAAGPSLGTSWLSAGKAETPQQGRTMWGHFLQDRDVLGGCQSVGPQFGCSP